MGDIPTESPCCPFCVREDLDFRDVDDSLPHLNRCPWCGQEYVVHVIVLVRYTTAKPQDPGTGDLFQEEP